MNLRYELQIIDLDAPEDNVIVHEYSSDIEDIKEAITGFEWKGEEND